MTIINILQTHGERTFKDLNDAVGEQLEGNFDGSSISWYFTTVKLDLEARKVLMRVPKSSPQLIRLMKE